MRYYCISDMVRNVIVNQQAPATSDVSTTIDRGTDRKGANRKTKEGRERARGKKR